MQCNIDARGKAVRLGTGIVMLVGGAGFALLGPVQETWATVTAIALAVFGVIGIGEGLAGWCVMRALGFKTRV